MPNITIWLNEKRSGAGRAYAEKSRKSLNALIGKMPERTVASESTEWLDERLEKMDRPRGNTNGRRCKREELHAVTALDQ